MDFSSGNAFEALDETDMIKRPIVKHERPPSAKPAKCECGICGKVGTSSKLDCGHDYCYHCFKEQLLAGFGPHSRIDRNTRTRICMSMHTQCHAHTHKYT